MRRAIGLSGDPLAILRELPRQLLGAVLAGVQRQLPAVITELIPEDIHRLGHEMNGPARIDVRDAVVGLAAPVDLDRRLERQAGRQVDCNAVIAEADRISADEAERAWRMDHLVATVGQGAQHRRRGRCRDRLSCQPFDAPEASGDQGEDLPVIALVQRMKEVGKVLKGVKTKAL